MSNDLIADLQALLDDGELSDAIDLLRNAPSGPDRDAGLAFVLAEFEGVSAEPVVLGDWMLLEVESNRKSEKRWWEPLTLAAFDLATHGTPMVALDADPYGGDEKPECADVLAPRADLDAWQQIATELRLEVSEGDISEGVELQDLTAGVGQARAFMRGPSTEPGSWYSWTWLVD